MPLQEAIGSGDTYSDMERVGSGERWRGLRLSSLTDREIQPGAQNVASGQIRSVRTKRRPRKVMLGHDWAAKAQGTTCSTSRASGAPEPPLKAETATPRLGAVRSRKVARGAFGSSFRGFRLHKPYLSRPQFASMCGVNAGSPVTHGAKTSDQLHDGRQERCRRNPIWRSGAWDSNANDLHESESRNGQAVRESSSAASSPP